MEYVGRFGRHALVFVLLCFSVLENAYGGGNPEATVSVTSEIMGSESSTRLKVSLTAERLTSMNAYHFAIDFNREGLKYVDFIAGPTFEEVLTFGPHFKRWPNTVYITVGNMSGKVCRAKTASLGTVIFEMLDSEQASAELKGFAVADDEWEIDEIISREGSGKRDAMGISIPEYHFRLTQVGPNPANPAVTLHYELGADSEVEITIYDVAGRRTRGLVAGPKPIGPHTVIWDGRTDAGREAGSGVYFVRMAAGDFKATRKVTIVR